MPRDHSSKASMVLDYHKLPRRRLQQLCKKHGIPANKTNLFMANALAALIQTPVRREEKDGAPRDGGKSSRSRTGSGVGDSQSSQCTTEENVLCKDDMEQKGAQDDHEEDKNSFCTTSGRGGRGGEDMDDALSLKQSGTASAGKIEEPADSVTMQTSEEAQQEKENLEVNATEDKKGVEVEACNAVVEILHGECARGEEKVQQSLQVERHEERSEVEAHQTSLGDARDQADRKDSRDAEHDRAKGRQEGDRQGDARDRADREDDRDVEHDSAKSREEVEGQQHFENQLKDAVLEVGVRQGLSIVTQAFHEEQSEKAPEVEEEQRVLTIEVSGEQENKAVAAENTGTDDPIIKHVVGTEEMHMLSKVVTAVKKHGVFAEGTTTKVEMEERQDGQAEANNESSTPNSTAITMELEEKVVQAVSKSPIVTAEDKVDKAGTAEKTMSDDQAASMTIEELVSQTIAAASLLPEEDAIQMIEELSGGDDAAEVIAEKVGSERLKVMLRRAMEKSKSRNQYKKAPVFLHKQLVIEKVLERARIKREECLSQRRLAAERKTIEELELRWDDPAPEVTPSRQIITCGSKAARIRKKHREQFKTPIKGKSHRKSEADFVRLTSQRRQELLRSKRGLL